jgi:hypothetical protein
LTEFHATEKFLEWSRESLGHFESTVHNLKIDLRVTQGHGEELPQSRENNPLWNGIIHSMSAELLVLDIHYSKNAD